MFGQYSRCIKTAVLAFTLLSATGICHAQPRAADERIILEQFDDQVAGVAICPSGKLAASLDFSERVVSLWSFPEGKKIGTLKPVDDSYSVTVDFSPDGKEIVVVQDDAISFWDVGERKFLKKIKVDGAMALAYCDAQRFGAIVGADLQIFDAKSRKLKQSISIGERSFAFLQFSADCKTAAASIGDNTLRIVKLGAKSEVIKLDGHEALITGVAIDTELNAAFSCSWDKRVIVWDLNKRKERLVIGAKTSVSCMAIHRIRQINPPCGAW